MVDKKQLKLNFAKITHKIKLKDCVRIYLKILNYGVIVII